MDKLDEVTLGGRVRGYIAPELAGSAWSALLDAPIATGATSDEGRLLFANQALLDLLRHPLDALLGDSWVNTVFPDGTNQTFVRGLVTEILGSPVTTRSRLEILCGDGRRRLIDITATSVRLPDGGRAAMTIVVEVPPTVAPSADGERGYRELVEDAPDVMLRFDAAGKLSFVNRAIERVSGHPPEAFYTDAGLLSRSVDGAYRALWDAAFAQVLRGAPRAFDVGLRHADGRVAILQIGLYAIRGDDGRVHAVEGAARDITMVRQLEQLKARNEERAALDRLKSQLLANVSHELRTPLVSIKGYNELLSRGALGPLTERQRRALEIAGANTDRLIELIETLLDFSRHEEGRLEVHPERIDVREAVKDAASALHDRIASRQLGLRIELGRAPLHVMGDRARLAQVFRALLGNAEKFTEASGKEILVAAGEEGGVIEVSVADRGIGIPAEAQSQIFDRFYQVDAGSTRRFGGAGLGLAMAKELVVLHGGEIRVDSQPGRGSTFTVRLPRADAPVVESAARQVVFVAAEPSAWSQLKPLLESEALAPLDLVWASSEADAARRAKRHRPDLIVLAFPQVEGVLAELRGDPETQPVPVVVVSAEGPRPIGRADLVASANDPQKLVAGLRRLLGRAPLGKAPRAPRVVIVEDELEILDFTRFVLEREGYEVTTSTTGREALSIIDGSTDLVVLDIALEESDGLDVCRKVKAAPATSEVPILIMTAMSGDEVRRLSMGAGADGYLMKPFGVDEFLRQVKLHLRTDDGARESA